MSVRRDEPLIALYVGGPFSGQLRAVQDDSWQDYALTAPWGLIDKAWHYRRSDYVHERSGSVFTRFFCETEPEYYADLAVTWG